MIKRLLTASLVSLSIAIMHSYAKTEKNNDDSPRLPEPEQALLELPDSVFENVRMEDLLFDEVYLKLARDGWSPKEITTIMTSAVKDKKSARVKFGYGEYAKQWMPAYGRQPGGDTLYQFVDTTYNEHMRRSVARTVPDDILNKTWPKIVYDASDRKNGIRRPGYFRPAEPKPSSGRMHWAALHPEDPDRLYVVPDGAGIFKTDDAGVNWTCITDNIPVRAHRSNSNGYAIPVDPDDWNHVFAFMNGAVVYESCDGGDSWRQIEGATHKGFKRGYCFRDAAGNLKFIGATQGGGWGSHLWISEDTCKTWTDVAIPDSLKDTNPLRGGRGLWFQYVEFDPADRNRIYLPTSRSILYFDDGAQATVENGVKKYHLKKMHFEVQKEDGTVIRPEDYPDDDTLFPFKANGVGQLVINPNNPDQMWFGTGSHEPTHSAVYKSDDGGHTWLALHDTSAGIGRGNTFGNELAWVWLGGFGVNFVDQNWVYGCSMSSAISSDGGRNFSEFGWPTRLTSLQEDGNYHTVSNSRHNADNHFILSHKSGRVFRGSDGGMLMKDLNVNAHRWTNIGGNMGQMLFYRMAVNEFGDQAMIGNTQDIDVQTFRYGRWGQWRGYEGSEASFNPYTGSGYYSGGGAFGFDGICNKFDSWFTSVNRADVVSGSWYMSRGGWDAQHSLLRIDDIGRSAVSLYDAMGGEGIGVNKYALARDKGRTTVFVYTNSNTLKISRDNGETFEPIMYNGVPARFSNTQIAADPDNSDILYLGQKGKVFRYYVNESRFEQVGDGLPAIDCSQLLFHEGSGDLYFVHSGSAGIYILENGSDTWRFWTKGFNGGKFGNVEINYTTQEMAFCDYGRGVWVADLEHPADRYFSDGFALKEYSHTDGRRTIGIDTGWTIPMYYYYTWTVNGTDVENPYQYLTRELKTGDRVQLRLTLRESPDVSTTSAEYVVTETPSLTMEKAAGTAIYSDGAGRLDLGYTDYFFNDFTIDFWAKPLSDGVLMANRQLAYDVDVKGWVLYIEGGTLKFRYAPHNTFTPPTFEREALAEQQQITVEGGRLEMGKWSHIAVTEKRDGMICLYVDGILTGSGTRANPDYTLNNSVCLSLFGDGIEYSTIEAYVDEIKLWNRELSADDIRHEMFSTNRNNTDGLVAYYNFNSAALDTDTETFSRRNIRSRIRANVTYNRMPVPLCATLADCKEPEAGDNLFSDSGKNIVAMRMTGAPALPVGAYAFSTADWKNAADNLDEQYYSVEPTGYLIRYFGNTVPSDTVSISFYPVEKEFRSNLKYRVYAADTNSDKLYWKKCGEPVYDEKSGTLRLENADLASMLDKKLLIVTLKPSIEVSVEGLTADGRLEVFDDNKASYRLHARTLENLTEPLSLYEIQADSILTPAQGFYFTKGEAETDMTVDIAALGKFNNSVTTILRGKTDDKMIPIPVEVVNRITPRTLGNSVAIAKGGLEDGNSAPYAALNNSNTVTLMGWVRIDSAEVLSGTRPLIFFRCASPSVATGIHLENGNLRCHWNEESWSWNTATALNVTRDDLGRWVHLALVVRPNGVDYYLNGVKNSITRTVNKGRVYTPLMLGQNRSGDTWFSGAFDQVGVWNRSLSQEEIVRYMHSRVLLNDSALVAYFTMDDYAPDGKLRESMHLGKIKERGTVTHAAPSTVPFDALARFDTDTARVVSLAFPAGKSRSAYITAFNGQPYNFFNRNYQEYVPLNNEFYSLVYKTAGTAAQTDTITLTYRNPAIMESDSLAVGMRVLGSTAPLEHFVKSHTVAEGEATFRIPYSHIVRASEIMFFVPPAHADRPVKVRAQFADGISEGANIILHEGQTRIPLDVNVISGNPGAVVSLTVKESEYARIENPEIDMNSARSRINIAIDRAKINRMGLNPVTVNIVGAQAPELRVNVCLEPRVELRLKNGEDPNTFVATDPVSILDVEAELVEGYLEGDVDLATVADMSTAMTIGNGTLLLNKPAEVSGMEFYPSSFGELYEGWNLVGNPYLANINLTKHQNVSFNPEKVTKFVYDCSPVSGNYSAYDMTDFDSTQRIHPFQSYFVQTMADEAALTITPTARENAPSKRTLDYYTATEETLVRLDLLKDGQELDHTVVKWENDAATAFAINEDAPKLWSLRDNANQLYTITDEGTPVSINTVPSDAKSVSLGVKAGESGTMEFRAAKISGIPGNMGVYLVDNSTGNRTRLTTGDSYVFNVGEPADIDGRFTLTVQRTTTTGADNALADEGYKVRTGRGTCSVSGLKGDATVTVYTAAGVQCHREHTAAPALTIKLETGFYILKIRENGKDYATKIVVK